MKTTQANWLALKPALNWLRNTYGLSLTGGYTQGIFWLSPDTAEVLRDRITNRSYDQLTMREMLPFGNNFAPTQRDVLPVELDVALEGRLTLRWKPSNEETVYPVWDTLAQTSRSAPPRSFAVYLGEAHHGLNGNVTLANKLAITSTSSSDNAKGALLFLVGTVGSKGSGADLELEDITSWRHGRPLYIPGNELTLPFRLMCSSEVTPVPKPDPSLWFDRWGPRGNIARSGTNGLDATSYSASSGVPEYAFNGNNIAGKLYSSAGDAPIDPVWRVLKPGTDFYTRDNRSRALDQPLPASKNFTIELKLPDGVVPRGVAEGFWGTSIGDVRFDVFYGGYSNTGYLLKDGDTVLKVEAPVPEGCLIRYVVRDGRTCEVSVNDTPVGTVTITGDELDLSALTHTGYPGRDDDSGTYARKPIEFLRITNDEGPVEAGGSVWLQVNFPRTVTGLTALTVITGDAQTDRLPKTCTVQVSDDGIAFTDHEIIELTSLAEQTVALIEPVDTRAVRLMVEADHGNPHCIEIGELELHYELPASTRLTRTGLHGNIALLGTNGLTKDSYTASRSDNGGKPHEAFNGWQDRRQVNPDTTAPYQTWAGYWEADNVTYAAVNQWLQVDFGQPISDLTGLSIRPYQWDVSISGVGSEGRSARSPKDITVQLSDDGELFTDIWSGTLEETGFQRVAFDTPITTRYLRVFIHTTRALTGSSYDRYVSIRELEVYQALPEAPDPAPAE